MRSEKNNQIKAKKEPKGVSTFLILLGVSIAIILLGLLVAIVLVIIFSGNQGGQDKPPMILGCVNFVMLALLMLFLYFYFRNLRKLQAATAAAERGEYPEELADGSDIADLINVVGRVSSRMSVYCDKKEKPTDDYEAFVPRKILRYCHVDGSKDIKTGVIGTLKGTRVAVILGKPKEEADSKQYAKLVSEIFKEGGLMLSSTSSVILAVFPGNNEKDMGFIESALKDGQILNVRYDTFDIVLVGSKSCMYVRAREHVAEFD